MESILARDDHDERCQSRAERLSQVADGVLELGEALFDAAIETTSTHPAGDNGEAYLVEERRAVAEEFYSALRLHRIS